MKLLLLILSMIFISCESEPKLKTGMYVKHIQSNCVGRIALATAYTDDHMITKYVCEITTEKGTSFMMESLLYIDSSLLKLANKKEIKWYKNSIAFITDVNK